MPDDTAILDDLLLRVGGRDREAFASLYDATAATAFGLALRVVRDRGMAEDVVQEVYLQAWEQAGSFEPSLGSARAWLMTLTHRRAVDRVRREESARIRHDAILPDPPRAQPDDEVVAGMQAAKVRRALAGLSEVQRQALELAYFGGMTQREVAAELDIPLGTAKTRIRDAMLRLRAQLESP